MEKSQSYGRPLNILFFREEDDILVSLNGQETPDRETLEKCIESINSVLSISDGEIEEENKKIKIRQYWDDCMQGNNREWYLLNHNDIETIRKEIKVYA